MRSEKSFQNFSKINKEEYFLGIKDKKIFETNEDRYASMYLIVGKKEGFIGLEKAKLKTSSPQPHSSSRDMRYVLITCIAFFQEFSISRKQVRNVFSI
jgi:hypothetical protein